VHSEETEVIIRQLRDAIARGKNWYLALLDAVRAWKITKEEYHGRHYCYLIDNEAFDWLALASRLCEDVDGLVPESEVINFLFFDRAPVELSREEFENLIGTPKYKAYLNFLYGVLVERFLILATTDEVRRERRVLGLNNDNGTNDEVFKRIYGATQSELLKKFREEKGYRQLPSISLSELNEFTYWLFKYRVKTQEKSRIASDTKKALVKLHSLLRLKAKTRL